MKSYKDLDVYVKSVELFLKLHPFTLTLPKYEMYELGSQLRRAADSIHTNIVEGYGRKRYKSDFVRFLVYAHASTLETINHLEKIEKIYPEKSSVCKELIEAYDILSAKIYAFLCYVENNWRT